MRGCQPGSTTQWGSVNNMGGAAHQDKIVGSELYCRPLMVFMRLVMTKSCAVQT